MADKNPGWINVEDELPPKENNHSNYSIMVIVCNSYSGECTTAKYNYSELKWVCDKWTQNNVDYWLPMPITPKKLISKLKEKELYKELCFRLPYNVKVNVKDKDNKNYNKVLDMTCLASFGVDDYLEIKPYLFPMSSMSKEQEEEFEDVNYYERPYNLNGIDWLFTHHFDFRDMISQGLAIPATKEIYEKN